MPEQPARALLHGEDPPISGSRSRRVVAEIYVRPSAERTVMRALSIAVFTAFAALSAGAAFAQQESAWSIDA
jgi:hypothetical protein